MRSCATHSARDDYVNILLHSYRQLPGTSKRLGSHDRRLALDLYQRHIPLETVQAALLLATARRSIRLQGDDRPLPPIRSLAYFLPVIEEICHQPLPDGYVDYLRRKIPSSTPVLPPSCSPTQSPITLTPSARKKPQQLGFKWSY